MYATGTMASKLAKFNNVTFKLPSIVRITSRFGKLANVKSVHSRWKMRVSKFNGELG